MKVVDVKIDSIVHLNRLNWKIWELSTQVDDKVEESRQRHVASTKKCDVRKTQWSIFDSHVMRWYPLHRTSAHVRRFLSEVGAINNTKKTACMQINHVGFGLEFQRLIHKTIFKDWNWWWDRWCFCYHISLWFPMLTFLAILLVKINMKLRSSASICLVPS